MGVLAIDFMEKILAFINTCQSLPELASLRKLVV
jgi:hypothetical protein